MNDKNARAEAIKIIININSEGKVDSTESSNPNATNYHKPTERRHEEKLQKADEKVQYMKSDKQEEKCLKCVNYVKPETDTENPLCIKVAGNINPESICKQFGMRREIPYSQMHPVRL